MNIKKYERVQKIKDAVEDLYIKTMRFILYPVIKCVEWYDKSNLKRKVHIRKAKKKIFRYLYREISEYEELCMTDCFLYENIRDGFSVLTTNDGDWQIPFHWLDGSSTDKLNYFLSIFKKDDDLIIEKMTLEEYLGEYKYLASGRNLDNIVYKITKKEVMWHGR